MNLNLAPDREDGTQHTIEHGGGLTQACLRYGGQPSDWLDLSTGINPNPVRVPQIAQRIWSRLPDESLHAAAGDAAALAYGISAGARALPVAGTQSVILLLPKLFDGPIAIVGPTYEEYRARFAQAGTFVDIIENLDQVTERHRLVILVNPNNPDGRTVTRQAILAAAERMAVSGGHVVVDEAFGDLLPRHSVAADAGNIENLIVLKSFGKFYGFAGLRLGFVLAAPSVLRRIEHMQGPWAVSGPALEIARVTLSDRPLATHIRDEISERHAALEKQLTGAGLTIVGGAGLFILTDCDSGQQLHQALCRHRILTRAFSYAPRWLRFGLCPDAGADERLRLALADTHKKRL